MKFSFHSNRLYTNYTTLIQVIGLEDEKINTQGVNSFFWYRKLGEDKPPFMITNDEEVTDEEEFMDWIVTSNNHLNGEIIVSTLTQSLLEEF